MARVRPPDHLSGHDAERPVLHPGRGRAGALRAPSEPLYRALADSEEPDIRDQASTCSSADT